MAYAGMCIAPFGHFWYLGLDVVAARLFAVGSAANVAAKVAADSLVYGPLHVALFFGFMEIAEGNGLSGAAKKLEQDFWPTFAAELGFWPVFQALNFWRVPVEHQLLAVNIACIFDSTFLCWAKHQDQWATVLLEKLKGGTAAQGEEESD
uniref:Protein Mpv17 n=1 Tax=Tetraselmis chuii TaxID=63592 RepID=A0A6U1JZS1_9CHLO|mmetsp:Transcript_4055/g.7436  ORF Transcript_4055/g.7436 Transcript_4055/m.7436 type:complete len:150 (+) Transcript_4055:678-1127(+)